MDCTAGLGTTFHAFGQLPNGPKIDYIFTDGLCKSSYVVEDIPVNGQYYSDHYAVVAEIDLED